MDVEQGAGATGNISKEPISTASTVPKYANGYHVYFLAIAMTFGGLHMDWSFGLENGFFIYLIGLLVIASMHISMVLCSAEMTGILPFSGGAYGFTRVTIGPYLGCVVGYCDAFRCLTYVMRRLFTFGRMMQVLTGSPHNYQPLFWLVFFIPTIFVDSLGSSHFWTVMLVFGIITFVTTVLYLFVTPPQLNFNHYVLDQPHSFNMDSGFGGFLLAAISAQRAYLGLTQLPLCCEETKEPRVTVPWAMVYSVATVFFIHLCITFSVVSHAPGVYLLQNTEYPLQTGYADAFGITKPQALMFSIVSVYLTCFGYAYSYGRLICALSRSGLLPSIGSIVWGERQSPVGAMIAGNAIAFVVMVSLFVNDLDERSVFASGTLASLVVYASIFVSFLMFRSRFTTLQTTMVNPFGVPSAIYGLFVMLLPAMYVFGYLANRVVSVVIFVVFIGLVTINYWRIASTQCYSPEEQSILLVLYVMTANRLRKKRNKLKTRASLSAETLKKPSVKGRSYEVDSTISTMTGERPWYRRAFNNIGTFVSPISGYLANHSRQVIHPSNTPTTMSSRDKQTSTSNQMTIITAVTSSGVQLTTTAEEDGILFTDLTPLKPTGDSYPGVDPTNLSSLELLCDNRRITSQQADAHSSSPNVEEPEEKKVDEIVGKTIATITEETDEVMSVTSNLTGNNIVLNPENKQKSVGLSTLSIPSNVVSNSNRIRNETPKNAANSRSQSHGSENSIRAASLQAENASQN